MNIKNLQKASTPRYDFLLEHCLEPSLTAFCLELKLMDGTISCAVVSGVCMLGLSSLPVSCPQLQAMRSLHGEILRSWCCHSHIFKVNTHLSRDFIDDWVKIGLPAKAKVKSEWGDKSFEQHCQYCEKESGNSSLVNLLSDPYARAAVAERDLKLVGGYYNFVHGTFGLWEVDVDIDIKGAERLRTDGSGPGEEKSTSL
ncbi:hypothetical protein VitviT2T_026372 [Vitis vinifera]|uniref:Carbonic anhydrase n=1 Tax=Vitis vinifera TaxID=29760 RepID=A0ABY9DLS1_VITVI|nr:hypothetical protein VitviT2T_026372 [Vitis vinifera]